MSNEHITPTKQEFSGMLCLAYLVMKQSFILPQLDTKFMQHLMAPKRSCLTSVSARQQFSWVFHKGECLKLLINILAYLQSPLSFTCTGKGLGAFLLGTVTGTEGGWASGSSYVSS